MNVLKKYVIATTAGALLATGAYADTFNVNATVQSAITLTESVPFTLGTIYILPGDLDAANTTAASFVVIDPEDGSTAIDETDSDGKIVLLGGLARGELTISGAAPFGVITITPTAPTPGGTGVANNLIFAGGGPNNARINILAITAEPATPTVGGDLQLDGSGAGTIYVGGTFGAEDYLTTATGYQDGVYTGSYEIDVTY